MKKASTEPQTDAGLALYFRMSCIKVLDSMPPINRFTYRVKLDPDRWINPPVKMWYVWVLLKQVDLVNHGCPHPLHIDAHECAVGSFTDWVGAHSVAKLGSRSRFILNEGQVYNLFHIWFPWYHMFPTETNLLINIKSYQVIWGSTCKSGFNLLSMPIRNWLTSVFSSLSSFARSSYRLHR